MTQETQATQPTSNPSTQEEIAQAMNAVKEGILSDTKPNLNTLELDDKVAIDAEKTQQPALEADTDKYRDILLEMIKPELHKWMEKNLPSMLEKALHQELKKIIHIDEL